MVRMGEQLPAQAEAFLSTAVDESEEMAEQLASTFRVDVDSAGVSEVASMLAKEIGKDAFLRANGAKFERELYEKYGVLKDVILHPTVQWLLGLCAQLWRSFRLFGRPPLGTGAGFIVCLMIYRKKVGFVNMCLTVAVLSGLNPFVVVAVVLAWKLWASSKFLPRGCRFNPEFEAPDDLGADKLKDDFEPAKVSAAAGEEYDHVVVGSDLGGLFCAALLSRCGRRVLVLEQGALIGAGAVVKAPEGAGDWEFETGVQCLGGGGKLGRFVKRLQLACLPGKEKIRWEKVGQLESDLCVHDMVSIGDGQQAVMFPAEQDKLLESLLAQFPERRGFFRAFFGQAEKEMAGGSMAYYLLKLFSSRPARWLDRVVIGAFVAAPAMAHVEIAKRSVSEMVNAMMKTQADGNDDSGAGQAALCALFRSENLDPARVSCAALMGQTSSAWGGMYHPKGGFSIGRCYRSCVDGIPPGGRGNATCTLDVAGESARVARSTAKALGEKEGDGLDPAGFRILRAARPRVHLCVGLQGNWLEDLDGTSSYVHHVRNFMVEGGGGRSDRHDWYRINFVESKDSTGWHKGTTAVVVTAEMGEEMAKMTIDGVGTTNEPIGPLRYTVQPGRSARDRTREKLLRRLHQDFPQTEGRDEFVMLAEQPRAGLSDGPERYLAKGVRSPTKLPGFFLAGEDLTISGMEGGVMGGWIAAHAALGYTATDMFLRRRSLASDIPNLDKLKAAAAVSAASATLALAWLILLGAPVPSHGFFRPTTRVNPPPAGPTPLSSLPKNRPVAMESVENGGSNRQSSRTTAPLLPMQRLTRRYSGSPLLMSGEDGEKGETEEGEEEEEEGGEEDVQLPTVEVPEMMSEEERTRLWMGVSRAELQAVKLERQGDAEEAAKFRARAEELRYEDPYTALQDQLDEAVKNEEFVKIARLRLQMSRIGVPPNAEMQARAEGKDPSAVAEETMKRMPGMMSAREGERGSKSGRRADGSTETDGYSSKSVTTTNGIRVEVRSQYYPEQSNPLKDQYIFVYKVKITNQSPQTVQLVSRTWEIKAIEATEAPQLVKGPGVVGQQPVLEPGQSFEYSSACPITCAPKEGYQVLGRMKGSYLIVMGAVGEAAFEAKIDPFYLILPQAVLDERGGGAPGGGGDMAGNNW
eukprot:g2348.t1